MGRYFKAQPVELNRDFIYQPPLELMAKALLKKDDDIQQQADTMELIRSLPIDFIDYHKEGAANIKNEINSDIDNFAKEIQGKAALDGSLKAKLNAYKNKLQERYSTGDIYNIQETAKNYREFEKKLEADKNINSALKEKYKQEYWNQYTNENPEGGYKSVFTPGPLIDDPNYIGEFGKWFKELEPDMTAKTRDAIGNKWITLTDNQKKELVLKEGMKNFMESRPDLKDVLIQQGKSSVFKDRNITFTDTGDIDYTKGFAFDLAKAANEYNYTQTLKDSITHDINPYENINYERAYRAMKDREQKSIEENYGTNTDVSDRIKKSNNIQDYRDKRIEEITAKLPENIRKKINNQKDLLKYTKGVKGLEKLHDELLNLDDEIERTAKASYDYFAVKGGVTEAEKKQKEFNASVKANHRNIRFSLAPKEVENSNVPIYDKDKKTIIGYKKGRQTYDSKSQYDNFYPEQTIGQIRYLPDGRKIKVTGVKFIENSAEPIIMNTPETTRTSINYNDAKVNLQFTGNLIGSDGKVDDSENGSQSFVQRAYFDMSKGVGLERN